MAEGRMLKKRISTSKKIANVSSYASTLYFMMFPHTDVEGKLEGCPEIIKGQILTYFKWTPSKIQDYLEELHNVGLIILYKSNDNQYIQFSRFSDFQRLDTSREAISVIPDPTPENSRVTPENSPISKVKLSKDKISLSKEKENIPLKNKHYDFVLLTEVEFKKLNDLMGKKLADDYINKLNNYIGSKGKKYKSHYHTILTWHQKEGGNSKDDNIRKSIIRD